MASDSSETTINEIYVNEEVESSDANFEYGFNDKEHEGRHEYENRVEENGGNFLENKDGGAISLGEFIMEMRGGTQEDWKLTYNENGHKFDGRELFDQAGNSLTEVIRGSELTADKVLGHEDMLNHFIDNREQPYVLPDWVETTERGETIHVTVAVADKEGNVRYETWSYEEKEQKEREVYVGEAHEEMGKLVLALEIDMEKKETTDEAVLIEKSLATGTEMNTGEIVDVVNSAEGSLVAQTEVDLGAGGAVAEGKNIQTNVVPRVEITDAEVARGDDGQSVVATEENAARVEVLEDGVVNIPKNDSGRAESGHIDMVKSEQVVTNVEVQIPDNSEKNVGVIHGHTTEQQLTQVGENIGEARTLEDKIAALLRDEGPGKPMSGRDKEDGADSTPGKTQDFNESRDSREEIKTGIENDITTYGDVKEIHSLSISGAKEEIASGTEEVIVNIGQEIHIPEDKNTAVLETTIIHTTRTIAVQESVGAKEIVANTVPASQEKRNEGVIVLPAREGAVNISELKLESIKLQEIPKEAIVAKQAKVDTKEGEEKARTTNGFSVEVRAHGERKVGEIYVSKLNKAKEIYENNQAQKGGIQEVKVETASLGFVSGVDNRVVRNEKPVRLEISNSETRILSGSKKIQLPYNYEILLRTLGIATEDIKRSNDIEFANNRSVLSLSQEEELENNGVKLIDTMYRLSHLNGITLKITA